MTKQYLKKEKNLGREAGSNSRLGFYPTKFLKRAQPSFTAHIKRNPKIKKGLNRHYGKQQGVI